MSTSKKRAVVARLRQTVKPQAGRGPPQSSKRPKNSEDDDYEPSDATASGSSSESEATGDDSGESSDSEIEVVKSKSREAKRRGSTCAGRVTRAAAKKVRNEEEDDDDTSDCERSDLDLSKSALHSVRWGRVILDEAHRIKGRTTTTALGAYALRAEYRWGLSGTPLQNRVGELYSLVRFLKYDPYAFYFCKTKNCDCKSMAYRFEDNRYCKRCGHTKMQHYSYFNQTISKPILKHGFSGVGKDALKELRDRVLDRLLLRRTKEERADDLHLPSMTVSIRRTELTDSEKDFYESLAMQSQLRFDVYANEGTVLNNYAHIFDLLTRLRQAVDHPYLIVHGMDCGSIPAKSTAGRDRADICVLCQDDIPARTTNEDEAQAKATCGHSFHNECVRDFLREAPQLPLNGGIGCPACFAPITVTFGQ
ncbi:DNA repair helicase, putative, partial [Perkinsus marinus ATCC 50983]